MLNLPQGVAYWRAMLEADNRPEYVRGLRARAWSKNADS